MHTVHSPRQSQFQKGKKKKKKKGSIFIDEPTQHQF